MFCRSKLVSHLDPFEKLYNSLWLLQSRALSGNASKKSKLAPLQERRMVDRRRLLAQGGDGGNGCCSVRRSRSDRRGRPDGGNGGRGGDVILECSTKVWDFSSLQYRLSAMRGGHGASKNKIGSRGEDKVVRLPIGTVIHLVEGEISSEVECSSSKALDPWEIPGTLDVGPVESAEELVSTTSSGSEMVETANKIESFSHDETTVYEVASANQGNQSFQTECLPASSLSSKKSGRKTDLGMLKVDGIELEGQPEGNVNEAGWEEDEESKRIQYNVAELTEPGQRIVIARGGEGGLGNVCFPRVSQKHNLSRTELQKRNSPDYESSDDEHSSLSVGCPGSEAVIVLELKSIADVGLVGMPNAGKSTILGAISKAKPSVGHYAFTTLRPNLGNLNFDDLSITVADIPGLIKGASENRGLGHAFLRHIERTKVLAYVLDLAAALDGRKGIPPWEQLRDLMLELELHQEGLSDRPSLVVANKIDEKGADEVYEQLKRRIRGVPVFPVCAILEEGIPDLKDGLRMLVNGGESQKLQLDDIIGD